MRSAQLPDIVVVGRLGRCHGVQGSLSVVPYSDVEDRFSVGSVFLMLEDENAVKPPLGKVTVTRVSQHKSRLLLSFAEVADRDAAELLTGRWLGVMRTEVPPADDGSYYLFELVGCEVFDAEFGLVGVVLEVIEDGGGLLLEVICELADGSSTKTYLIPFVKAFLSAVDTEQGRIDVELPPGLLESCVLMS